ncbi:MULTISPECIES: ScbA/BarX family gamma-butyrolactone biosynthesis protein [unclassified Streptomyces]|uniref:ScbA/BarX family gamma-butyrolactone biosynthesis protein n=1 Tax=unclassified Streptomyces TaxID=2593676 RepID=UPI00055FBC0B
MDQNLQGLSTPVPAEFVHRANPADILPTGWTRSAENRFSITARWPAEHPFFVPHAGDHHDPLLVAETMRQATMLVSHAEFGVPEDDQFVMWDLSYDAVAEEMTRDGGPAEISVDLLCSDVKTRGRGLREMRTTLVLSRDGRRLASGGGGITCTSAAAYRRMRGDRMAAASRPVPLLPAVDPRTVGRDREKDVVLAPGGTEGRWRLRVDTTHPTLFRRANDHVPGMLLLEAARQAAAAATGDPGLLPVGLDARFHRYVELDEPCWIEAEVLTGLHRAGVTVQVLAHQGGTAVLDCTLTSPQRIPAAPRVPALQAG